MNNVLHRERHAPSPPALHHTMTALLASRRRTTRSGCGRWRRRYGSCSRRRRRTGAAEGETRRGQRRHGAPGGRPRAAADQRSCSTPLTSVSCARRGTAPTSRQPAPAPTPTPLPCRTRRAAARRSTWTASSLLRAGHPGRNPTRGRRASTRWSCCLIAGRCAA